MNLGKTLNQLILYANLAGCNILEIGNSLEEIITETTYYLTGFI